MTSKPRILIVEDEAIIAMHTKMQLQAWGYEPVGHATRGEEALEMVARLQPDLVLMDIQLAGNMDGIAAAKAIRARHAVPVVFLSAFSADDILTRALMTEPFGYVLKPYTERELRTVIEMALYKHHTEAKLRDALAHTQTILDHMFDAVITISDRGLMESFNLAACAMFGYTVDEVLGQNIAMLMPERHRSQHDGYLQRYRQTGEARILGQPRELDGLRKDGSLFPLTLSVSETVRTGKKTFIGLIRDITAHRLDVEQIRRLAYYDPLTGLPNRRLLLDRLTQAMQSSARSGQHGAVVFLNLDHFKQLNDHLGRDVGDVLLQQVAQRLLSCVRECDSAARLGSDEFVVLLDALGTDGREAATQGEVVAAKILVALRQPYALRQYTHLSTPSIGIVVFKDSHASTDALMKEADVAMYQAKAAGRNTIRFYDPAIQAAAAAYTALEQDLRRGLELAEFLLHYQVQVDGAGTTLGAEALVRWQHPQRGMVPPADFITLAEKTGLILPLGQWVLETACAQLGAWAQDPRCTHWTMAVNVSASQFAQADFVARVDEALHKTGANPGLLKLELTESMLVKDVDETIVKMNAIRARGVRFSLDDFGTGYSSLSYLKRLPLAQLKIDQSFVRDILTDASDAVIARTVLALGHNLGLKVIAEGVETLQQRNYLAEMGCDAFQGYYFGRPGPAVSLTRVMSENSA